MRKLTKAVSVAAAVAMTATCFSTTAFADDTFKIGGIGPITGGAAVYGQAVKNATELAVNEINALGGNLSNTYGISIEELKMAIPSGISKINVDTDIRLAVTRNMKELFAKYPEKRTSASIGAIYELLETKRDQFDPRVFLPPIMDTVMYGTISDEDVAEIVACIERGVKEVVGTLIVQFGSFGKAPLIRQKSLDEMIELYKG